MTFSSPTFGDMFLLFFDQLVGILTTIDIFNGTLNGQWVKLISIIWSKFRQVFICTTISYSRINVLYHNKLRFPNSFPYRLTS